MLRPGKVATPAIAAAVTTPESVPPPGAAPMATVTLPVNPVAVLPNASRAVTWTAGVNATPAVTVVGRVVKASWVAGPGMTAIAAVPSFPSLVAEIVTWPGATPRTKPVASTVANAGALLSQVIGRST